jgi:hypothetical protein
MLPFAWRDCGEEEGFGPGGEGAGATVLYRAGRFGALKAKSGHSGWECPLAPATEWIGEEVLSTGPEEAEEEGEVTPVRPEGEAEGSGPVPPS